MSGSQPARNTDRYFGGELRVIGGAPPLVTLLLFQSPPWDLFRFGIWHGMTMNPAVFTSHFTFDQITYIVSYHLISFGMMSEPNTNEPTTSIDFSFGCMRHFSLCYFRHVFSFFTVIPFHSFGATAYGTQRECFSLLRPKFEYQNFCLCIWIPFEKNVKKKGKTCIE